MQKKYVLMGMFLLVAACGKKKSNDPDPIIDLPPPAYEAMQPVLILAVAPDETGCYHIGVDRVCTKEQHEPMSDPEHVTMERVLQRSFVFDPWAGERLKQVLQHWPKELLKMASCTSAILIGKTVNPSYYESGILYLNPKFFAVTDAEKATFPLDADPRHSAFDTAPFRRTMGTGRTSVTDERLSDVPLEEREMILRASYVMIHELAHACDRSDSDEPSSLPSRQLSKLPVNSVQKFADVYLRLIKEDEKEVQTYKLNEFVDTLMAEPAIDYYSHYSRNEHYAMLVESFLMKHYFGADTHSLFTEPYKTGTPFAERTVRIDVKNKVCAPASRDAALQALQAMKVFKEDFSQALTDCTATQTPVNQPLAAYADGLDILLNQ